jgi:hypothetical protein
VPTRRVVAVLAAVEFEDQVGLVGGGEGSWVVLRVGYRQGFGAAPDDDAAAEADPRQVDPALSI